MTEKIVRTKDGVTVLKEVMRDGVPMPAVRFAFRSERPEPVAIRMLDTLPAGVSVDDVGFHPEYGKEYWRTDGEQKLAFERVIGPDDRALTVYFVRNGSVDLDGFETAPTIENVASVDERSEAEVPLFRGPSETNTPIDEGMTVTRAIETDGEGESFGLSPEPDGGSPSDGRSSGETASAEPTDGNSDTSSETDPDVPLQLNDDVSNETSGDGTEEDRPEFSTDGSLELNDPTDTMGADVDLDTGERSEAGADSMSVPVETGRVNDRETTGKDEDDPNRNGVEPETSRSHEHSTDGMEIQKNGREDGPEHVSENEPEIPEEDVIDGLIEDRIDDRLADLEATISRAVEDRIESWPEEDIAVATAGTIDDRIGEFLDENLTDRFGDEFADRVNELISDRLDQYRETSGEGGSFHANGSVAERLAAELESMDEATLTTIGNELSAVVVPHHVEARIKRVEAEFNELAAYTDALREFIDENGSGQRILEDLEGRVASIESNSDELISTQQRVQTDLDALETAVERLDDLPEELASVTERVDRNGEHVEAIEDEVETLEDRFAQLTDQLTDVSSSTDRLWNHRNQLVEAFEDVANRLSESVDDYENADSVNDEPTQAEKA